VAPVDWYASFGVKLSGTQAAAAPSLFVTISLEEHLRQHRQHQSRA
jgi:hypothetical protein